MINDFFPVRLELYRKRQVSEETRLAQESEDLSKVGYMMRNIFSNSSLSTATY